MSLLNFCFCLGPVGTPYARGCLFFDVLLQNYPLSPPKVKFLTTNHGRVRFNPNLYANGKVCLSLLGTWTGPGWIPNQSTLLQVLISIQGLILVSDPYFNEPGYEISRGSPHGTRESERYNHTIRQHTFHHAIIEPLQHVLGKGTSFYPEFQSIVRRHFMQQAVALKQQLEEWKRLDKSLPVHKAVALLDQLVQDESESPKAVSPDEVVTIE